MYSKDAGGGTGCATPATGGANSEQICDDDGDGGIGIGGDDVINGPDGCGVVGEADGDDGDEHNKGK